MPDHEIDKDEVEYTVGPQNTPEEINQEGQEQLPGMKKSFWQRNGGTIITLAILGLVIGSAVAINERRTADDTIDEEVNVLDE